MEQVYVPKNPHEKAMQRALIQYRDPKNRIWYGKPWSAAAAGILSATAPSACFAPRAGDPESGADRKPISEKTVPGTKQADVQNKRKQMSGIMSERKRRRFGTYTRRITGGSIYEPISTDRPGYGRYPIKQQKEISPGCKAAIEKALATGKEVVLSSRGCRPELTEFRELIPGLRYVNCTSGAMVYDFQEQRVIYSNTMDIPTVKEIFLLARKEEAMLHILDEKSIEQTNQLAHIELYGMGPYKELHARTVEAIR